MASTYELWFKAADKDGSGYLTSKEMKKALKAKGYKVGRKQFKEQFRQFDTDGDKKITLKEYLMAMGQVPDGCHKEAAMRKAFERADRNKDGSLDIGELNGIFMSMKQHLNPDELFKIAMDLDKDKSGKINYREFMVGFSKAQGFDSDADSSDDGWD